MINNVLYLSTPFNRVVALDAEGGRELWAFDPESDVITCTTTASSSATICTGKTEKFFRAGLITGLRKILQFASDRRRIALAYSGYCG